MLMRVAQQGDDLRSAQVLSQLEMLVLIISDGAVKATVAMSINKDCLRTYHAKLYEPADHAQRLCSVACKNNRRMHLSELSPMRFSQPGTLEYGVFTGPSFGLQSSGPACYTTNTLGAQCKAASQECIAQKPC